MRGSPEHHIGFPEGAPAEVRWSSDTFVRPVEPSEKCSLRPYVAGLLGILVVLILLLMGLIHAVFLEETFLEVLIFIPLFLLLLLGFFEGHILKFFLMHKVKSRPGRLFKPDWKCIFVGIEDSNTFRKIKFMPEDFGLIRFSDGFVEIETTSHRARFAAKDITLSEHITRTWLKVTRGVKIAYNLGPWPWNVTVMPLFQSYDFFGLLTEACRARWLLKKFQESFEMKPDSQKVERRVIKTAAFLGIVQFGVSLIAWGMFACAELNWRGINIDWPMYLHAIPAAVLFFCFILAFAKANHKKIRTAAVILGLAVVGSVSCFFFDTMNHFYQFPSLNGKYYYINWWWHNLPFKEPDWGRFKYGYVDKSGKFVIEPKFEYAGYFSDGLAKVEIGDLYGYIDKTGEYVVAPKFKSASRFSEGLASVEVNDKHGYIDTTGRIVIEPKFSYARDFSEGLAVVNVDGNCGYVDKTGQVVIEPKFFSASKFSQGLAVVKVGRNYDFGYIDTKGKMVIEPKFEYAYDFSEDLAAVEFDRKWGFIDKRGQMVIEPKFDSAGNFSEGLAKVRINDKYGYIDKSGKFVIGAKYEDAGPFRDGKAIVLFGNNGKLGYRRMFYTDCIDKTGKTLFKTHFERIIQFRDGFAFCSGDNYLWGCINEQGEIVIKPQFFTGSIFSEGLAPVQIKIDK